MADRDPIKPATEVQKLRFIIGLIAIVAIAMLANRCSDIVEHNRAVSTRAYDPSTTTYASSTYRAAAQKLVEQNLRDPGSAQFSDLKVVPPVGDRSTIVCGRVNSRNGYGGMSGPKRFVVGDTVAIEDQADAAEFEQLWASLC